MFHGRGAQWLLNPPLATDLVYTRLMNKTQTCIEPSLSEDDLSDLLWLVDNYGDKLTEVADYVTSKDVARLAKTLETMLNCLG